MKTIKKLCIVTTFIGLIGATRAAEVAPGDTTTAPSPAPLVATSQTVVTSQPVFMSQPVVQAPQESIQATQLLAYGPKTDQRPQEFADISQVPAEVSQTAQSVVQGTSSYSDINHEGAIGVGPLIGEPMGAGVKFWFNREMAADGGVGWSFENPAGVQ